MSAAETMTVPQFQRLKGRRRLTMLTAYDFPTARLLDQAGVDALLVGDSLGMVVQGRSDTLAVSWQEMLYHAEMVGRAVRHALVVVDLPFPLAHLEPPEVLRHAAQALQLPGVSAVKLEGGAELVGTIRRLVQAGVPVMGHCGLRPQSVHRLGGYRVQRDAQLVLRDAQALEEAGAFAVVLECISRSIAAEVTRSLSIPTIGIGAGPECDGQVLVLHDLLGLGSAPPPKFARAYANLAKVILEAVQQYCRDVQQGHYPGPEHCYE